VAGVAASGLLLAACGGDSGDDSGVAALGEDGAPAEDGSTDAAAIEEEMLNYTECLRDQGLDVEDPVIDANGNVTFGGPGPSADGAEGRQQFFEGLEAAEDVCGQPPGGAFGDHGGADQTEVEDALVEFAECMREAGFDMPDPDLSGGNPFAALHDMDTNDPAFQQAFTECRDVLTQLQPGGGG
jgi:hypothetical protein